MENNYLMLSIDINIFIFFWRKAPHFLHFMKDLKTIDVKVYE